MYQVKAQNGYEIQVIGKGEKGLCRLVNQHGHVVLAGTYQLCLAWLHNRGLKLLEEAKS